MAHLNGHIGAVSVKVIVPPIKGDVVATAIDGAGTVAHELCAFPASPLAGAEDGRRNWSSSPGGTPAGAHTTP